MEWEKAFLRYNFNLFPSRLIQFYLFEVQHEPDLLHGSGFLFIFAPWKTGINSTFFFSTF